MAEESPINRRFRESMRAERESLGWSQGELSRRLIEAGWPVFHQTTITRIENGTRPVKLDEATAIADMLGVGLDELTRDVLALETRRAFHTAVHMRADLANQGWDYFLQLIKLRRELERTPEGLPEANHEEAAAMLREQPGHAAESMIRDWMERLDVETYEDFRERWYADDQARWEKLRQDAERRHGDGDDDATA